MSMVRLLVFTPTYGDGPQPECLSGVAAQVFDGQLTHEVSWHNPYPTTGRDMRNVTAQYQRAHQLMRDGGYDGMLLFEHDMRMDDPSIIRKLWNTPAPVVYAPYLLRHGSNVLSLWQWTEGRNLGMSLSLYPKELAKMRRVGEGPVCGVGFGCTLIRREVFSMVGAFRGPDNQAPDLPFAMDCIHAGIHPWGRFDIECGHYHNGEWLWPWRQREGMRVGRIYMLQDVTANVNGDSTRLTRGHYYSLPADVRDALIRAGYATYMDEPVPVKVGVRETADLIMKRETAVARIEKRKPKPRARKAK
jgi:hypothetical protein